LFNKILDQKCNFSEKEKVVEEKEKSKSSSCQSKIYEKIANFFARDLTEQ